MAITQGTFDIVFDAIKSTLETYNSTQDPEDQFTLYADFYRMFQAAEEGANVFLYIGSIVPIERTSYGYTDQTVTYYVDKIVKSKGIAGATYTRADEAAGIRFRLLIQQVLEALQGSDNFNFGLEIGTISKKEVRFDPLSPEEQRGEQPIAAGRTTLTLTMSYRPDEIVGVDLEETKITADKWSALLQP